MSKYEVQNYEKHKARNSKHETILNDQNPNYQNIEFLKIRAFEF